MKAALYYNLYVVIEMTYERENIGLKEEELYPMDWYSIKDYRIKIEMLEEAIKNKTLVHETEKYKSRNEGLRLIK